MFKPVNALEKLEAAQLKLTGGKSILDEVKAILEADDRHQERVETELSSGSNFDSNDFDIDQLESHRIFHIDAIKDICIDYRLRFLNTKMFKNKIPQEALNEIKALEKAHDTQLKGFKIMAPAKLFKLENADDPVLFAPIGNNYYYLIHKWGNDLHPMRKWLMKPFKNVVNLLITMFIMSILFTNLIVDGKYGGKLSGGEMMITFLFVFKSVVAIVIYYGFALGKNFSNVIWDSKYFNA